MPSAVADANSARAWLPWSYQPDSWVGEAELQAGNSAAAARSFREAVGFDDRDWRLWLNVARVTSGTEQRRAVLKVRTLYPLSPEAGRTLCDQSQARWLPLVPLLFTGVGALQSLRPCAGTSM